MESSSVALVLKALDGLTARAAATSQNIANANSPNYRPVRVTFEQALASAARRGPGNVAAVEPRFELDAATGDGVRTDLELATASTTASRYAALVQVLDRQLQLNELIVSGGK